MDSRTYPLAVLSTDDSETYAEMVRTGGRPGLQTFEEFKKDAMARSRGVGGSLEFGTIESKWDLAKILIRSISEVTDRPGGYERDARFWNYLALVFSDVIWKPKEVDSEYYVFAGSGPRTRYRHRVAGPYLLARRFDGELDMESLLSAVSVNTQGEVLEQLLGRKYTVNSKAAILVAARLFVDHESGELVRGSGGKGRYSVRRYANVVGQIAVTYDIGEMTPEELISLLPQHLRRRVRVSAS